MKTCTLKNLLLFSILMSCMLSCSTKCDCEFPTVLTCEDLKNEFNYDTEDVALLKSQIIGEWLLVCSTNPWTGQTTTYEDPNATEGIIFKQNGDLVYRNGQQITLETTWDIRSMEVSPGSGVNRIMLILNGKPDIFELGPRKLRVNQTPYDGLDSYYTKR